MTLLINTHELQVEYPGSLPEDRARSEAHHAHHHAGWPHRSCFKDVFDDVFRV